MRKTEEIKNDNLKKKRREKKVHCFRPGSNRGPSACEADVITTTLRKHSWEEAAQSSTSMWCSDYGVVIFMLIIMLLAISRITIRLHRFRTAQFNSMYYIRFLHCTHIALYSRCCRKMLFLSSCILYTCKILNSC